MIGRGARRSRRPRRHPRLFHLSWSDEDFETLAPDVVIPSAELDRWPGIEADPEGEARIAAACVEGLARARAVPGDPVAGPVVSSARSVERLVEALTPPPWQQGARH